MRINVLFLLLFQLLLAGAAYGAKTYQSVEVADPYLEMHTGPGRGYPIFHVVERGEWVEIIRRRTDWFKVRTDRGKEGWVHRTQMAQTLQPTGEPMEIRDATLAEFQERRWEAGLMAGDFDGADVMTAYGGFAFTPNFSAELAASKVLGDFSDSEVLEGSIVAQPFPQWRFSPFFALGTGIIHTEPNVTLVQEEDRTDSFATAGGGLRVYLTRRFLLRMQYKNYVIFQSKDENQEIDEWKAGFSFFF